LRERTPPVDLGPPALAVRRLAWRDGIPSEGSRVAPQETPIALVYDGGTQAVMMATAADLEDFAVGFSLTEGLVGRAEEVGKVEIVGHEDGIELRIFLPPERATTLARRRRLLAGPTGCGLCGVESLAEAVRPARRIASSLEVTTADIEAALAALGPAQDLGRETRAVHAAGFWTRAGGLAAVREDVGRHNALDKLVGAIARSDAAPGEGLVLLTSRVSVEMVQKTAALGAPVIVAVSAPTVLAVRVAEAAGITLVAVARPDGFEVFTHPHRIGAETLSHVA
jgi:FdhD protein